MTLPRMRTLPSQWRRWLKSLCKPPTRMDAKSLSSENHHTHSPNCKPRQPTPSTMPWQFPWFLWNIRIRKGRTCSIAVRPWRFALRPVQTPPACSTVFRLIIRRRWSTCLSESVSIRFVPRRLKTTPFAFRS